MHRALRRGGSVVVVTAWLGGCAAAEPTPAEPPPAPATSAIATVWYRGVPAGVPRLDDLAAIRAYGFEAMTWSAAATTSIAETRAMATRVGLRVLEGAVVDALTPESARHPGPAVSIAVGPTATSVFALAWRAIAHGARTVAFDAGTTDGAGFTNDAGDVLPWVAKAQAVARELTFNREFIDALRPGPTATVIAPRPDGLDVRILQTDRSWVLIATNTSDVPVHAVVRIPEPVPPALWVNLLDGIEMSMLNMPGGPRWTFDLEGDGAFFYAIDKPR